MSDDSADPDRPAADGVDARQLAFVGLAFAALVVAAFLAPTVAVPADGESRTGGDSPEHTDAREPREGPTFDWLRWFRWLIPGLDGEGSDPRCVVQLSSPPQPGADVTIAVHYEDQPLADAPVWFEDRRVGRTDDRGRVTGEVPYVKELSLRVGVEGAPDCRATTGRIDAASTRDSLPAGGDQFPPPADVSGATHTLVAGFVGVTAARSGNASVSYDVGGEMELAVDGDPYPGEELQVRATIDGRPVPDAEVTADGETTTRTDDAGTATVIVPDDGREEVVFRASRGEFAAGATIDVLLLEASLDAPHLAVVPGADATVVAGFANRSAESAVVTVDGDRLGRTDAAGRLDVVLPTDPTATVRVEARDQTATTSVVDHYVPAAALVGLLVTVASGFAYWRRDARTAAFVVAGSAALLAVAVAVAVVDAFYGPTARNALLAAVLVPVVAAGLLARRETLRRGGETTKGWLARLVAGLRSLVAAVRERSLRALFVSIREWLLAAALRIASALGAVVDSLRAYARDLLERVRSLPRSVSDLLALAAARLRTVPRRALDAVRTSTLALAVPVGAAAALAGGYAVDGRRGLAIAAVALVAVGVVTRRFLGGDDDEPAEPVEPEGGRPSAVPTGEQMRDRSFRELWRAFARLVAPGTWRTSTPDEVARAAVEKGYPRRPVEELTALFREVEYGGRSLSAAVRERAADAYERLRDGGEEP